MLFAYILFSRSLQYLHFSKLVSTEIYTLLPQLISLTPQKNSGESLRTNINYRRRYDTPFNQWLTNCRATKQRWSTASIWTYAKLLSQAAQSRCTVVRPIQKSIKKWKIVTPKNFNLKLCIRNYVGEATHHANFGSNRFSGGFSPYRRNGGFWEYISPRWRHTSSWPPKGTSLRENTSFEP